MAKSAIWRRALWELHVTILGLAATGAVTMFMTESLKVMFGKPRPDCLARCQPDVARLVEFVVGGFADRISGGQLVSKAICTATDHELVNDGFKSFPSGHASGSAAALGYISLFLAGKFGVLSLASSWTNDSTPKSVFAFSRSHQRLSSGGEYNEDDNKLRMTTASTPAPPLSLTVVALVPYAVAIFVASSRWLDYRHHAVDILFGFAIGTFFAITGYRFSQLHLARAVGAPGLTENGDSVRRKEWRPVLAQDEEAGDQRRSS
jgi:membrane-associated phospholipid phosphatase